MLLLPFEALEGVLGIEILFLGELLKAFDALHAPTPHEDVEGNENEEDEACDNDDLIVAASEGVGEHEQGVVGAVEEDGVEEGAEEMGATVRGIEFGQGEVVAHDDGEEEVGRYGQQSAKEGRG